MNHVLYDLLTEATEERPVCRFEYQLKTGLCERQFRKDIEEMRRQGIRVISSAHKKGYWIAKSEEEYKTFRREQISRIQKMQRQIFMMDSALDGQCRMLEV